MRRCDLASRTRSRRHEHQVGRARRRRAARRRRQPADRGRGRPGPRARAAGAGRARGGRGRRPVRDRRASASRASTTTRTAASASSRTSRGRGRATRSALRCREALGVPVRLINDARAFTLAEARVGAGQGCASLIGVTLGTGVGGGIVLDGRLVLGVHGTAGEIGHQVIDLRPEAPRCGCGNTGCLEAYVGAGAPGAQSPERPRRPMRSPPTSAAMRARTPRSRPGSTTSPSASRTSSRCSRPIASCSAAASRRRPRASSRRCATACATHVHLTDPDHVEIVHAALGVRAGAIGAALRGLELGRGPPHPRAAGPVSRATCGPRSG